MTGAFRIRQATVLDVDAAHAVRIAVRENRLSHPSRVSAAEYVEYVTSAGRGWVAEIDGTIVGFAIGRTNGQIWSLFVHPDHERRGIGSALHDTMVAWLFETGLKQLRLTTDRGTRAESFYFHKGWQSDPGWNAATEVAMTLDAPRRGASRN